MPAKNQTKSKKRTKRTRKSKKNTAAPVEEAVAAPVEETTPEEVVLLTPEEETTNEATNEATEVADTAEAVETTEVAEPEAEPETNSLEVKTVSIVDRVDHLKDLAKNMMVALRTIQSEITAVKKEAARVERVNQKLSQKKRRRRNGDKKKVPSGIMKPHKVDPVLSDFMKVAYEAQNLEPQEEYSRVDVLRAVSKYVEIKNLKETAEGKRKYMNVNKDKYLKKVFPDYKKKKGDDRLQYTDIMGAIGRYFPSSNSSASSSS